jgi:adenylate kinase
MDVILLGAPGAGKGTQAKVLEEHSGLLHVASGDLFRAALRQGTELGMLAKSYMDRGELVPDEVVIRMIMERIGMPDCAKGVIFDGFPRTSEQAIALGVELQRQGRHVDHPNVLTFVMNVVVSSINAVMIQWKLRGIGSKFTLRKRCH